MKGKYISLKLYFGKTDQINEYNPSLINNKSFINRNRYGQTNMINNLYNQGRNYNYCYNNYNNRYKSIDESSRRNNTISYQYYFSCYLYS